MPAAPSLRARIISRACAGNGAVRRWYAGSGNGGGPGRSRSITPVKDNSSKNGNREAQTVGESDNNASPSLYEQLFPDQYEADLKKQRKSEIPRLPIENIDTPPADTSARLTKPTNTAKIAKADLKTQRIERRRAAQGSATAILVLRNASKNLLEDDFKRIIPQGKHLEGWKLEQGDILSVVRGRDLDTLEQTNFYYLIFSSALSAFTYQGQAARIHQIVATHTPVSTISVIPPPPGLMIDGMDAHAAIQSFTLTPATQSLELRQLHPPVGPMLQRIARHGGYSEIVTRKERMPYEARLTLEGPQLHMSAIKHVLTASAKDRGLAWSGGDELAPRITKWEPIGRFKPSPYDVGDTYSQGPAEALESKSNHDSQSTESTDRASKTPLDQQKRRTPPLVYVAGFHTERAMQSFVHFWHRRPMDPEPKKRSGMEVAELPPIANVEALW